MLWIEHIQIGISFSQITLIEDGCIKNILHRLGAPEMLPEEDDSIGGWQVFRSQTTRATIWHLGCGEAFRLRLIKRHQ